MNINVSDKIQSNQKLHGQRFINKKRDSKFLIDLLIKNINNINTNNDKYNKEILESLQKNHTLNFSLSRIEVL